MDYEGKHLGRGKDNIIVAVFSGIFTAALTLGMFFSFHLVGAIFVLVSGFITGFCIRSYVRQEDARSGIKNSTFWWDSPYWPRSSGIIDLTNVSEIRIYEGSTRVLFVNGKKRIRGVHYGTASKLKDYLEENYKEISVKFVENFD